MKWSIYNESDIAKELLLKNREFFNKNGFGIAFYEGFTRPGLYDFWCWADSHFEHIDDIVAMYEVEKEYRIKEEVEKVLQ